MIRSGNAPDARSVRARFRDDQRSVSGHAVALIRHSVWMLAVGGLAACHLVFGNYETADDDGIGGAGVGGSEPHTATGGDSVGVGGAASGGTSPSEAECEASDATCVGQVLTTCVDGRWSSTTCPADLVCDRALNKCACPTRTRCDGIKLYRCTDELTSWIFAQDCDMGCLEDPEAHCKECESVGAVVCLRSSGRLMQCMGDFTYLTTTICPTGCDDQTNTCLAQ